jgi:HTH-type transcriptional regulator / antitoxin HigA
MENFEIKPIKNEVEYKATLKQLNEYWGAKLNTKEGDILELLLMVIETYEAKNHVIEPLDPIEAIKYEMEERGLNQKDLVKYFGTKSRVSEVLNRKRPLTLKMMKVLHNDFKIPAKTLLAY